MKLLHWIKTKINYLQLQMYGWMEHDKELHFFVGMMLFSLSHKMVGLPLSVSMLVVTVAGVAKEVFDKYIKHRLGLKQGTFDKEDIAYTMLGGATIMTIVGVIHFLKMVL